MSPTDPHDSDDVWGDLARELNLEPAPVGPTPPEADEEPSDMTAEVYDSPTAEYEDESPGDGPDSDDESEDDGDEAEGAGESGGDEGDPGTKKRRRRRRRRKKKGADTPTGTEAEGEPETVTATAIVEPDAEPEVGDPGSDEGATPEMTRELIRTWNVPSWEEIVTGLYRPQDHHHR